MRAEETSVAALKLLEETEWSAEQPPTVVVSPPDGTGFISGNREGLVQLAMAALRAASGERQEFKGQPWLVIEDLDWAVNGIQYDELAHMDRPPVPTRRTKIVGGIFGYAVVLVVVSLLIVGAVVSVSWVWSHI